jgi:hypothetical protein
MYVVVLIKVVRKMKFEIVVVGFQVLQVGHASVVDSHICQFQRVQIHYATQFTVGSVVSSSLGSSIFIPILGFC